MSGASAEVAPDSVATASSLDAVLTSTDLSALAVPLNSTQHYSNYNDAPESNAHAKFYISIEKWYT